MMNTVSLEVAKKLKEARWMILTEWHYEGGKLTNALVPIKHRTPAPTIAELLEALPNQKNITTANLKLYRCDDNTWEAYFDDWSEGENATLHNILAKGPNAPDCLALLWLAFKEKNLV